MASSSGPYSHQEIDRSIFQANPLGLAWSSGYAGLYHLLALQHNGNILLVHTMSSTILTNCKMSLGSNLWKAWSRSSMGCCASLQPQQTLPENLTKKGHTIQEPPLFQSCIQQQDAVLSTFNQTTINLLPPHTENLWMKLPLANIVGYCTWCLPQDMDDGRIGLFPYRQQRQGTNQLQAQRLPGTKS